MKFTTTLKPCRIPNVFLFPRSDARLIAGVSTHREMKNKAAHPTNNPMLKVSVATKEAIIETAPKKA